MNAYNGQPYLDSCDGGRPSFAAILSMKPPSPTPAMSLIVFPSAAAAMVEMPIAMPTVMSMYSPAWAFGRLCVRACVGRGYFRREDMLVWWDLAWLKLV